MTEFHLYLNRHLFHLDDYIGTYQPLTNTVDLRAEYAGMKDNPYFKGATVLIAGVDPNIAPPIRVTQPPSPAEADAIIAGWGQPEKRKAGRPHKILPK